MLYIVACASLLSSLLYIRPFTLFLRSRLDYNAAPTLTVAAMSPVSTSPRRAIVIGGGPAGLMAAEVLVQGGVQVDLYDAMPSVGRKFLLAGKGGMNITHSEPIEPFLSRYGARRAQLAPLLDGFGPNALREWVHQLGIATFVGTSGRIFPTDMKA